jgi:glycosyltransferase involved in cell wall biosynthesis
MRYWDIAQQFYPSDEDDRSDSHWRKLIRQLVGERFAPVNGDEIDPDLAAALSRTLPPRSGVVDERWPRTMHCIGTLGAGGAERQLVNLMTELAKRGHDGQTLFTIYPLEGEGGHYKHLLEEFPIDIRVNNFPIRKEGIELIRNNPEIVRLIHKLPRQFHAWTMDMWVDISLIKPDIAHFWLDHPNIWGAPAALLADVPTVILSTRNVHPENFPYLAQDYMRPWYQWLTRCPRVHLINNSHAGAESYAEWIGIDPSRFEVILNGVNLSHLHAASAEERVVVRNELGLPQDVPVVVGAFRMSDEKRPLLFVETVAKALAVHPRLHGVLMGAGPRLADVQEYVRKLGLSDRLHCLGRRGDLPRVMSAMDVFLHTAWWEGTPNVVLEAQQLALPVVVAKGGGAADAVDHGRTGVLVEREDEEGLARALIEVLDELDAWKARAQRGPQFIEERFSVGRMVNQTLQFQRRVHSQEPMSASRARAMSTEAAVAGSSRPSPRMA